MSVLDRLLQRLLARPVGDLRVRLEIGADARYIAAQWLEGKP